MYKHNTTRPHVPEDYQLHPNGARFLASIGELPRSALCYKIALLSLVIGQQRFVTTYLSHPQESSSQGRHLALDRDVVT
jgi:hypothetical protein